MESNLFEALRIKENEVVMCRFLADLLDPKGWHGLGTQFLKSFLEKVIQLEGLECLERTCVMTEYLIDNGRRIDIILQNPGFSLPIEAKINARDQQGQCYDYLPYARKAPLVYLTKHGGKPSEWSRKTAGEKEGEIRCVSWESICDWLEQEPEVLEQVRQYTEAIRSFLPKSTKTSVDCGLIRDVLAAFRSGMGQGIAERYGLEELPDSYRSYQNWKNQNLSYCPGLNYRVKGVDFPQKDSLQMWFRIEVAGDGYLSAGFCLVDVKAGAAGNEMNKVNVKSDVIEDLKRLKPLMAFIVSRDNWWFAWRFSNGKQDVARDNAPNFKTMNKCAAGLLDQEKQPEFVEDTIRIFEDQLLRYLGPSDE